MACKSNGSGHNGTPSRSTFSRKGVSRQNGMVEDAWRHDARRDVDVVFEVNIERNVDDAVFEGRASIFGLHDNEHVEIRIGCGFAARLGPEQPHIQNVFSQRLPKSLHILDQGTRRFDVAGMLCA